jgi:NAD(P)-dependent dehydrogenase (short-subunit alcohol dehydrogenase family)
MSATPPLPFDLAHHHALVTGANHGIGAATAETLASCGASVLLAYWSLDDRVNTGAPGSVPASPGGEARTRLSIESELLAAEPPRSNRT